jgi:hypothetical protein
MSGRLYLLMMDWVVLQSLWPASPSASWWSSCGQWRLFVLRLLLLVSSSWLVCCLCWRCKCLIGKLSAFHGNEGFIAMFVRTSYTARAILSQFLRAIKIYSHFRIFLLSSLRLPSGLWSSSSETTVLYLFIITPTQLGVHIYFSPHQRSWAYICSWAYVFISHHTNAAGRTYLT